MSAVLFEHAYRGHLWRLEVAEHNGRTFANWRKWYDRGGDWAPTREGCTFPLNVLSDLSVALVRWIDLHALSELESGT